MTIDIKRKIYKWIYYCALMLASIILETTVFSGLRVFNSTPALIPFIVSAIALGEGVEEGVVAGLVGGFLCDAIYSGHDGFFTVMLPVLVYLICFMNTVMYWKNYGMAVLDWIVLILLLHTTHFVVYMFLRGVGSVSAIFSVVTGEVLVTAVFTPFLYLIVNKIQSVLSDIEE